MLRNPYRMRNGYAVGAMLGGVAPLHPLRLTDLEQMVSRRVEEEVGRLAYEHEQQLTEVRQAVWDEGAAAAWNEARQQASVTLDRLEREIGAVLDGLDLSEDKLVQGHRKLINTARTTLRGLNREVELG